MTSSQSGPRRRHERLAKSFYFFCYFGLGGAAGAFAGGLLYEQVGLQAMYRRAGIWLLLGAAAFLLVSRFAGARGHYRAAPNRLVAHPHRPSADRPAIDGGEN